MSTGPNRKGEVLSGRFQLEREIGAGGMGVVYAGTQIRLGRRVVIKLMRANATGTDAARFEKEARLASGVPHPHIVSVYDFGTTEDDELFLAMEYLEGITLRQRIAERGPHDWRWVAERMRQIALALQAAHAAGIIHRDLKPANVFLVDQGGIRHFVKVLDFGLAKRTQASSPDESDLTRTGEFLGTPAYISPEQVDGEEGDARSDLYSLGVMALEMLAGINSFRAATVVKTLIRHLEWTPPSAHEIDEDIPEPFSRLIARLLAKDPTLRPQSATELLDALQVLVEEAEVAPARVRAPDATQTMSGAKSVLEAVVAEAPPAPSRIQRWLPVALGGCLSIVSCVMVFEPGDTPTTLADSSEGLVSSELPDAPILALESPPTNLALVALGRKLYMDEHISRPRTPQEWADGNKQQVSCNSCHPVGAYGTTSEPRTNYGVFQAPTNTPSTFNAALLYRQKWDAASQNLLDIVAVPILSKTLMDAGSFRAIHQRLKAEDDWPEYERLLAAAELTLGENVDGSGEPTGLEISLAVAEYMKHLTPLDSEFDRTRKNRMLDLSADAEEGYQRFQDLGCIACHQGRAVGGNMVARLGIMAAPYADRGRCEKRSDLGEVNLRADEKKETRGSFCRSDEDCDLSHFDSGRCVERGQHFVATVDLGAHYHELMRRHHLDRETGLSKSEKSKRLEQLVPKLRDEHPSFKVPSLRNVAKTAPYFHDGSAKSLEQAIRTMGDLQLGRTLTDTDVRVIKAFLESLTGTSPEARL